MKTLKGFFTGKGNNVTDELTFQKSDEVASVNQTLYQCPMKCEDDKMYNKEPGNCPVCNMKLVPAGTKSQSSQKHHHGCC